MSSDVKEQGTFPQVVPAEVPQVSTGCNGSSRRAVADETQAYPTVVETSCKTARVSVEVEENEEAMEGSERCGFSQLWTNMVMEIRMPFVRLLHLMAGHAACRPTTHIIVTVVVSVAMLLAGVFTNADVVTDEFKLWTPKGSPSLAHKDWKENESGFPAEPRYLSLIVHAGSRNVLGQKGMKRVFEAFDTVRNKSGYSELCQQWANLGRTAHVDENGDITCQTTSPTAFWSNDVDFFEQEVSSDAEAVEALSQKVYPSGMTVDPVSIFGNAQRDESGKLVAAESYKMVFLLPDDDDNTPQFEEDVLDLLLALREDWVLLDDDSFRLEVYAHRSYSDEFVESIMDDVRLLPIAFAVMAIFSCIVFWRRDPVYSRSLLGVGAVSTVLLSISTGYGLLFAIGVPLTNMTQVFPFIMLGIGLSDSFILSGAFRQTDKSKDISDRIHDTIDQVGFSILLTTASSVLAFGLACLSSIPAVYWLCLYAFPTILINFVYQVTFFVALLVLDERRVQGNRRDCPLCCTVRDRSDESSSSEPEETVVDKFMEIYSHVLMKPWMKALVVLSFSALLGVCIYSATLLEQEVSFTDFIPSNSYVQSYWNALDDYSEGDGVVPFAYFRFVNQGDQSTQLKMEHFVNDLVGELVEVSKQPTYFWLRDFQNFTASNGTSALSFNEQMDAFLNNSVYSEEYSDKIVRDQEGNVVASRVWFRMDQVDIFEVNNQIDALSAQREVGEEQSINGGSREKDWSFFTLSTTYYSWEYYSVAVNELILSTVIAIASVTFLGTLCIPHWSAFFFVCPLICTLYADLLGVLQFADIKLNLVAHVTLLLSVGLFVEFLIHILARYFESSERTREARVKETLGTIGKSVLLGGLSTFLGVIPLAFSTNQALHTVFVTFLGLVTLGIGHGLILLPVLLSLVGSTEPLTGTASEQASRGLVIPTPGTIPNEDEDVAKTASTAVARNAGNSGFSDGSSAATTVPAETPVVVIRTVDGEESVVESVDTRDDADVLRQVGLDRLESIKDCRQWRRSRRMKVDSVPEEDEHDDDVSALQQDDDDDADLDAHDDIHQQKLMTLSC